MIDAIAFVFVFSLSCVQPFQLGVCFQKHSLSREAIVNCEDLKDDFTFGGELKHLPTSVQNQAAATAQRPKNVRESSHQFL